ncbi:chromate transporter [Enterococcus timonensis]|uniref:chromate transporter n=1 Tax=Enterococcus timonensis TaxID=1852364 RepID=UPI0009F72248|nr:chromate transporter [Enterococcus timonensis]
MNKNLLLFKVYLMAGTFTFSGGMAMLPVIERELCVKHNLIDRKSLYEYSTLAQTFPGVIALTNACFVGKKINGYSGMLAAGIGAIFPAYVLMSLATILYQLVPQEGIALSILAAVRATSAAFLFSVAISLAKYNLTNKISKGIAIFCFIFSVFHILSAPWLIGIAALLGYVTSKRGGKVSDNKNSSHLS